MKQKIFPMLFLLTALLFTGCSMQTVEEMYAVPKRSDEFSSLQTAIDAAMTDRTYAAPVSGDNQQSVQTADLDGDGVDEYLVFAMNDADRRLQVLIFRQEEQVCSLWHVIETSGTAFGQVEYISFDQNPGCELVIGSLVSDQVLRSVSVYNFSRSAPEQLLMAGYSRFLICDLDDNGFSELMVIRPGEVRGERGAAVLYSSSGGQIQRSVETELSARTTGIRRVVTNTLQDGTPAVFIASAIDEQTLVTDVLALREDRLTNVSYSAESDMSLRTLRNDYIYAEDIDEDGLLELPRMLTMKPVTPWADTDQRFLLRWFTMDVDGRETNKLVTFHYYSGGWCMMLDQEWASRVSVQQNSGVYIFYLWNESYQDARPLFTIHVFTDGNRDEDAVRDGRFVLYRAEGVAYAANLSSEAASYGLTEEYIINHFRMIRKDWRMGES